MLTSDLCEVFEISFMSGSFSNFIWFNLILFGLRRGQWKAAPPPIIYNQALKFEKNNVPLTPTLLGAAGLGTSVVGVSMLPRRCNQLAQESCAL